MADINDLTDDSTAITWNELERWSLVRTIKKAKTKNSTVRGLTLILADGAGRNFQYEITINITQVVPVPARITSVIQAAVNQDRISQDKAVSLIAEIQNTFNNRAQHRSLATQVERILPHHVRLYDTCKEKNVLDDIWEVLTPLISHPRTKKKNVATATKWSMVQSTQNSFKRSLALKVLEAYTFERFIVMPSHIEADQLRQIFISNLNITADNYLHGAYDTRVANPILRAQLAKPTPNSFIKILRSEPFKQTQWIVNGAGQLSLLRSIQEVVEISKLEGSKLQLLPDNGPPMGTGNNVGYRTTKSNGLS